MKREIKDKDKDTRDLSMVNYRAIERKKTEIGRGREVKKEGINGLKRPMKRERERRQRHKRLKYD